jgi:hypothetical protein
MEGVCGVLRGGREPPKVGDEFPTTRKGGLDRLIRVFGYVFAAVYKWRKKKGAQGPVIINPIVKGGGIELATRHWSSGELGNCTCWSWPRREWESQGQRCWPRMCSQKEDVLDKQRSSSRFVRGL